MTIAEHLPVEALVNFITAAVGVTISPTTLNRLF